MQVFFVLRGLLFAHLATLALVLSILLSYIVWLDQEGGLWHSVEAAAEFFSFLMMITAFAQFKLWLTILAIWSVCAICLVKFDFKFAVGFLSFLFGLVFWNLTEVFAAGIVGFAAGVFFGSIFWLCSFGRVTVVQLYISRSQLERNDV